MLKVPGFNSSVLCILVFQDRPNRGGKNVCSKICLKKVIKQEKVGKWYIPDKYNISAKEFKTESF